LKNKIRTLFKSQTVLLVSIDRL